MNGGSLAGTPWPTPDQVLRVFMLHDYNTRVVVVGSVLLGIGAGIIGTFMLLRKRALMGDAVSHATLPGIGIAFLFMVARGGSGQNLPGLLVGATLSGLAGMGLVILVRTKTRLKEDAALGIVLSVFFGLGIAILGVIQQLDTGHAAGLESFIYGKTASMLARDATLIAGASLLMLGCCLLFFKEFTLLCFDQDYAASQGWSVPFLDALMMGLVVLITVIGLQAVGLILMIALLVIPPAAARFWTHHLVHTVVLSALIGALSGYAGSTVSALVPRLPAGAIIVVIAGIFFLVSMIFGYERGIAGRLRGHLRLSRSIRLQHLLRVLYEWNEEHASETRPLEPASLAGPMPMRTLQQARSWSLRSLRRGLARAKRQSLIRIGNNKSVQLTREGFYEASRVVRNHRLWETYLITFADIAPVHVDRSADEIEHVLGHDMVARLETQLQHKLPRLPVPESPHP